MTAQSKQVAVDAVRDELLAPREANTAIIVNDGPNKAYIGDSTGADAVTVANGFPLAVGAGLRVSPGKVGIAAVCAAAETAKIGIFKDSD